MGKQSKGRRVADNEAYAVGRMLKVSPQKLGLLAGLISGRDVSSALAVLTFSRRRIAGEVKKVLESAIANAENNHQLDVDKLYICEASVGKNLVMKRFRARARGRGAMIRKPFAQIRIVLREQEEEA